MFFDEHIFIYGRQALASHAHLESCFVVFMCLASCNTKEENYIYTFKFRFLQ